MGSQLDKIVLRKEDLHHELLKGELYLSVFANLESSYELEYSIEMDESLVRNNFGSQKEIFQGEPFVGLQKKEIDSDRFFFRPWWTTE